MELSQLVFKSDTTELERASNLIGGLVTNMSKLDKASRDAAQTEATLAKAAKSNAEANLANAKAQDVRLKSTIAADKADQSNEKSQVAKTKALESHTKATQENVSILQRQTDIYDFLAQGFSKGQAGILASAKATGQYSKELEQVLELQKQFTSDPFDRSDTGLKRLQRTIKEVTDAQGFFNAGHNLTSKQARELSNDLDRLNAGMKQQGKSYQDITKAQAVYKQQFIDEAAAVNKANSALAMVEKQRKDVVSATNYVTQADQKMAAALNQSNAALDKGGTDSLVRYETALRKSGLAQEVVTQKLAKYNAQLTQVGAAEEKRKAANLARALQPQFTDIGVSLYSGQAPLTVLLQQSGQMVDLFKLSGVEAQNLGKVMKEAFAGMLPAIGMVAKGLASLVTESLMSVGKAVTGLIADMTLLSAASSKVYAYLAKDGPSIAAQRWAQLGKVMAGITATGIGAAVVALGAVAVGLKQVIAQENELNRAVALSGGSMGATAAIANTYVAQLGQVTGNSTKANEAIIAMAKSGNIASSSVMMVGEAAIALNKAMGTPIEETVKQFDKLATAPSKTLIEIAKASGLISAETVRLVMQYEKAGETAKAAELAQRAYANATKEAANTVKENYGTLTTFAMGVSNVFSRMWDSILGVGRSDNLDSRIEEIRKKIQENAQATPGLFLTQERIDQDMKDLNKIFFSLVQQRQVQADIGKQKELNVKATTAEEELDKLRERNLSSIEKHQQEITRLTNYKGQLEKDGLLTDNAKLTITKAIASENKKIADELNKNSGKQTKKDLETEIDILNKRAGLASSYNNELDSLQRLRAKGLITEKEYIHDVEELIKLQPFYLDQQKQTNAAHDLSNKLMGKADMLGKDYYKTLEQIQKFQDAGLYSPEKAEQLRQAAFDQTELAKQQLKYVEESTKTYIKYREESQKSLDASTLENQKLDDRVTLLGLTTEEQKQLKIQQQQRNALLQVDLKLTAQIAKLWEDVRQGKIDPILASLSQVDMERAAADERKLINKEVAVQYAEDLQKEIDAIKNGISDSIVTALFEGGKAGSKKIRDTLVSVLRQKVTMVVDVSVNAVLNNLIGGALGGATSSGGASIIGSAAASAGGSLFAGATGLGTTSSLLGGFSGSIIPASMVGPSVAAPTVMSGVGNALSAIPGWGWAIAGIAALASIFGKKSTPHMGAASQFSAAGGMSSVDLTTANTLGFRAEYSKEVQGVTGQVAKTLTTTLDSTAKAFGKTAGYEISTAFADDSSKDGAWGSLVIKQMGKEVLNWADTQVSKWAPKEFASGEEGAKEYMQAIAISAKDALITTLKDVDWAKDMLNALGDNPTLENLGQVVQQINLAKAALMQFSKNMPVFANLTDSATSAMVKATGSMENLVSMMNSYYENFYTAEEKRANVIRDITATLNAAGAVGITESKVGSATKDEFRKYYESIVAAEGAASPLAVALLKVSAAFAEITQTTEEATQAISDSFARENEILRLTGQEVLAVSRERAKELATLDPTNRALQERIYALQDEQSAIEKSKAAAEAAAQAHEKLVASLAELARTALRILDNAVKKEKEAAKSTFDALMKDIDSRRNITIKAFEAQKNMLTVAVEGAKNLANLLKEEANRIRGYATGMKLASNPTDMLGGALSAQARLKAGDTSNAVLEAATNIDPEMFATWADYATNFFATQGIISDFADKADRQASEAASQVALLEHQLELTELQHQADLEHYTKLEEAAKVSLETQIAYYDSILEIANMQLEEALGTKLAVMALGDAMNNFSGAIGKLSMVTRNEVTSVLPSLSGIPSFDVGTNYVPKDMLAQIHKGEAIVPAAYNPSNPSSNQSLDSKVVEVLVEVKTILSGIQTTTVEQKIATDKLVRLIDETTEGGTGRLSQPA